MAVIIICRNLLRATTTYNEGGLETRPTTTVYQPFVTLLCRIRSFPARDYVPAQDHYRRTDPATVLTDGKCPVSVFQTDSG